MATGRKTGGGSRKGRPNKVTADIRTMVRAALDGAGGVNYLKIQAKANPAAFLTLVGKIIPQRVEGHDGGAIKVDVSHRRAEAEALMDQIFGPLIEHSDDDRVH